MANLTQSWQGVVWYRLRQFGPWGLLGLAMLVVALSLLLIVLVPAIRQLDVLDADMAKLRAEMPMQRGMSVDRSPQTTLKAFYDFLPAENTTTKVLAQLYTLADAQDLEPQKVEYVLTHSADANYSRYQITLPVRGHYVAVRRFMTSVLNEMPAAAFNEVSFKRVGTTGQEVEAMMRLTIFLSGRK